MTLPSRLERRLRLLRRVARQRVKVRVPKNASTGPVRAAGQEQPLGTVPRVPPVQVVRPQRNGTQAPEGKDERVEARDAMKRALPRYARINNLVPSLSWGRVQKELQAAGYFVWKPSAQEKRGVAGKCVNPEPAGTAGGMVCFRDSHIEDLMVFRPMGESQISRIEMLHKGSLVFQQKASAFPALALAPPPGCVAIDACAAPGSKTSQLASLMKNDGTVHAFDKDKRRLDTMVKLMEQRNATCVEARNVDFLKVSPKDAKYSAATHFLLDPSCSSSGMTTEPLSDEKTVAEFAMNQENIILHAMRFPGAEKIAYSTCSVYEEENECVVQRVLASQIGQKFELAECLPWWPRRGHPLFPGAERCVRTSWDDQTIGFFVALFQRKGALQI